MGHHTLWPMKLLRIFCVFLRLVRGHIASSSVAIKPSTKVWATLTRCMAVVYLTTVPVVLPFTGCAVTLVTTGASSWSFSGSLGDPLPLPNSQLRNCIGLLRRGQHDESPPILPPSPAIVPQGSSPISQASEEAPRCKGRGPEHASARRCSAAGPKLQSTRKLSMLDQARLHPLRTR